MKSPRLVVPLLLLAGCALESGPIEATTFSQIGSTRSTPGPEPEPEPEVECRDITDRDCEQAVSAIVNGLPNGREVVAIEIGPLEERLAMTPEPPWSASAVARMADGFVYELVVIQEFRPGPMEISFAPD